MTGAVSWEMLIWIGTLLGAAIFGAGGAVLWGVRLFTARDRAIVTVREEAQRLISARDQAIATAREEAQLRSLKVETETKTALEVLQRDLQDYKAHVGETFATKQSVTLQLTRLDDSLKAFGDRFEATMERLTARIDRVLELRVEPPTTQPRSRG